MDEVEYQRVPLVLLTKLGDIYAAQLLAARLESEGIEAHVRSEGMGPYPMSVGRWGEAQVWVAEADLEEAAGIALAAEADAAVTEVEPAGIGPSPNLSRSVAWWMVAAVLLAWFLFLFWLRVRRLF